MHKALREVLGAHVQQKGSLVDPDKTRFDFAHNAPMTDDEIRRVEAIVNAEILDNAATQARVMPIDEAQKIGAMMLFGEKYGDEVRVLDIGTLARAVRRHARRAHRRHRLLQDRRRGRRGGRHPPRRGGRPATARSRYVQAQEATARRGGGGAEGAGRRDSRRGSRSCSSSAQAAEKELARLKAKAAASAGDDLAGERGRRQGRARCSPRRSTAPTRRRCARRWTS